MLLINYREILLINMQQHGWISKYYSLQKKPCTKFILHDFIYMTIYQKQISSTIMTESRLGCQELGVWVRVMTRKDHKETFLECWKSVLSVVVIRLVYTCQNHQAAHLKSVQSHVHKIYLSKVCYKVQQNTKILYC